MEKTILDLKTLALDFNALEGQEDLDRFKQLLRDSVAELLKKSSNQQLYHHFYRLDLEEHQVQLVLQLTDFNSKVDKITLLVLDRILKKSKNKKRIDRMNYWIMKSEPEVFSIDQLEKMQKATWDGVRNYQVRNMFRDEFNIKDLAYFYHSSCEKIGIAGIMEITSKAYPDPTFKQEKNPWLVVDVKFIAKFPHIISRQDLQATYKLKKLKILEKGSRLSVTKISKQEFELIKSLSVQL